MLFLGGRAGPRTVTTGRLPAAKNVWFTDDCLVVDLADGRTLSVPLSWYPRLLHATPTERANWQLIAAGYGIHWPDVDEDLSTEGLLEGNPAPGVSLPGNP